jgi:flagellar basal body P-ring formation protein FlgA
MIKRIKLLMIILLLSFATVNASREKEKKFDLIVEGRESVKISQNIALLEDIAKINPSKLCPLDLITLVSNVPISESLVPGSITEISGEEVVNRLIEMGVDLKSIGYSFPKIIKIERVSQNLSLSKVEDISRMYAKKNLGNIFIDKIDLGSRSKTFLDLKSLTVDKLVSKNNGRAQLRLLATSSNNEEMFHTVTILYKELKKIPVATKLLVKGAVVTLDDVINSEIELSQAPDDVVTTFDEIIGKELKAPIKSGKYFTQSQIKELSLVKSGSPVNMIFTKGRLKVTASGIALSDGIEGEQIRVKNISSNKVLKAVVVKEGIVEVNTTNNSVNG